MKVPAEFTQLQKNWIGRTVVDRRRELKEAEENEDYDKCIEIKDTLDKGLEMARTALQISEDVFENPYSYPRLIHGLFNAWDKISTYGLQRLKNINQEDADGMEIIFKGHIYHSIRFNRYDPKTGEAMGIGSKYDIEHPKYADCAAIEGDDIYVFEKVCGCDAKGVRLYEVVDDVMMRILEILEETETPVNHLNPIQ